MEKKELTEKQTMEGKKKRKKLVLGIAIFIVLFVIECCVFMYVIWMCFVGYVCNILSDYGNSLSERLPQENNKEEIYGREGNTDN